VEAELEAKKIALMRHEALLMTEFQNLTLIMSNGNALDYTFTLFKEMLSRCVKPFETVVQERKFIVKPFVKDGIVDSSAITFGEEVKSGVKGVHTSVSNHQKMIDANVEAVLIPKTKKVTKDDKGKKVLKEGASVDFAEAYSNEDGEIMSKRKPRTPPTKYGANSITVQHHLDTADKHNDIIEKAEVNRKKIPFV